RKNLAGAFERAFKYPVTEARILLADRHAGGTAYCGARLARDDDLFPGGRRYLDTRADNLHLVPVRKTRDERHDRTVNLGADRGVADVGMDGIGEIDRGRAARQRNQLALRCEAEHLILEQLELGVLEKL